MPFSPSGDSPESGSMAFVLNNLQAFSGLVNIRVPTNPPPVTC